MMRQSALLAGVFALAWAGATDACCFFKCCGTPAGQPGMQSGFYDLPYLKIVAVEGIPPVTCMSPNEAEDCIDTNISYGKPVTVVVESDYDTGQSPPDPDLTVTDDGPYPLVEARTKGESKKYKPKKKTLVVVSAYRAGADPRATRYAWLFEYEITLAKGTKYKAYASKGSVISRTVNFHTGSS